MSMSSKIAVATKKTVLVVDDNQGILDVMKLMLEQGGFSVDVNLDGSGVLKLTAPLPDLIFLDLRMSGHDGSVLCSGLKADKVTKHIPVVILSANGNIKKIASDCGADSYLTKPFQMKEMLEKARQFTA